MFIIKLNDMYVRSQIKDTPHIHKAKRFKTYKQTKEFAYRFIPNIPYEIVEIKEEKESEY